jgi:hypothetical protein
VLFAGSPSSIVNRLPGTLNLKITSFWLRFGIATSDQIFKQSSLCVATVADLVVKDVVINSSASAVTSVYFLCKLPFWL